MSIVSQAGNRFCLNSVCICLHKNCEFRYILNVLETKVREFVQSRALLVLLALPVGTVFDFNSA